MHFPLRLRFLALLLLWRPCQADSFGEELLLRTLPDGKTLAYFEFQLSTHQNSGIHSHYAQFPRDMGNLFHTLPTLERFRLSFTQGRWQYSQWSNPIVNAPPSGVQLYAWSSTNHSVPSGENEVTEEDSQWTALTHTLAGEFCASLQFMDRTRTAAPSLSFGTRAKGTKDNSEHPDAIFRYATLPREATCTENLTPLLKLLPCKGKAGLASLLNPYRLFDADFHSMVLDVRSGCSGVGGASGCDRKRQRLVMTLGIMVVLDPVRLLKSTDYSLSRLFDRQLTTSCPSASVSRILVETSTRMPMVVEPNPWSKLNTKFDRHSSWNVYSWGDAEMLDIHVRWTAPLPPPSTSLDSNTPLLLVDRHWTGYGEERGGIAVRFVNRARKPTPVIYLDILPWFLKLYLHTLSITINGVSVVPTDSNLQQLLFQPAMDRKRPSVLEAQLNIPALSILVLHLDFDKVLLRYTEYPPDANRGFDIGSACVTVAQSTDRDLLRSIYSLDLSQRALLTSFNLPDEGPRERPLRIYTQNLLLSLPTPDFSMPYNVITLTSTVIALFFGSLFNMMVRSFQPQLLRSGGSGMGGLRQRVRDFVKRFTTGRSVNKGSTITASS